jgi:hypothetical protein
LEYNVGQLLVLIAQFVAINLAIKTPNQTGKKSIITQTKFFLLKLIERRNYEEEFLQNCPTM